MVKTDTYRTVKKVFEM